ncbi:flagellar biosynthesis protein FliQ [Hydrogenivirga sp. 128-5-R1-1]|uniref:flagellar biosynthesis protein FliQ n=1 Tax=Hydrogenivirga sp. 128-5-R1-1 TaxID=392423 RepID=UPI00015F3739|nr:flagellar biosynthesis protein FliQ [Hydrogenivirga sp. 128-5-R1-1]EDP76576.1 flagellar biosynthesis protein FliQ [Hydrogenivirga sp. 128-5-R1-1]
MSPDLIVSIGQRALEMAVLLAMPVLLATFIVGLVVSIFQAATQIQEMTLAYIPKIVAAMVTIFVLGGWMMGKLVDFTKEVLINIPVWIR